MSDNIESSSSLVELLDEAAALELNVGELYKLFSHACPEDQDFWWRIALEEGNHASLIEGAKKLVIDGVVPRSILPADIRVLRDANTRIKTLHQAMKENPPSRKQALSTALELEEMAAEEHLQKFLGDHSDSRIVQMFQQLHAADQHHSERLQKRLEELG